MSTELMDKVANLGEAHGLRNAMSCWMMSHTCSMPIFSNNPTIPPNFSTSSTSPSQRRDPLHANLKSSFPEFLIAREDGCKSAAKIWDLVGFGLDLTSRRASDGWRESGFNGVLLERMSETRASGRSKSIVTRGDRGCGVASTLRNHDSQLRHFPFVVQCACFVAQTGRVTNLLQGGKF